MRKFLAILLLSFISGCGGIYTNYDTQNADPIDRPAALTREDFANQLLPRKSDIQQAKLKEPPIPKISDALLAPKPPKIGSDKTISISVTDDVQLKDVFMEIARLADIDVEIDSNIKGGVIFRAKDKPASEVVSRIADLAGLRYSFSNGILRVEADVPYVENYQANFLNLTRKNEGKISANTKLGSSNSSTSSSGSSSGSSGSGSSSNGSESSIEIANGGDGDLWNILEKEINSIIGGSGQGSNQPQGGVALAAASNAPYVSLNRMVGMITVKTTAKNHKKVSEYLAQVKDYYSSQVLIEAKVVEIVLSDEYSSGIDWSALTKKANGFSVATPTLDSNFATFNFNGKLGGNDINAAITLAQAFGTTRTLSSPRILAMNNQQAILSFATNETYFTLSCKTSSKSTEISDTEETDVTSTINTIPVGVILNLQASIDNKNNEIVMNVRPTLSRLTGEEKADPGVEICAKQAGLDLQSTIPQVDVREMDSVLKIRSGEIMAIGGMIDQKDINTDTGVPYASEIPILGNAFKNVKKNIRSVQTVIFLQATIVPSYGVDSYDQDLYNKFNTDPRPLEF